jgi:NAD(P)-dependent dehydrogenase (short-subunit alcohol dehydrogenase family)
MSRVLVTGGASGFGQALAAIYAARGDQVLVTDLVEDPGPDQLPHAVRTGEVHYRALDVRDDDAWDEARGWVEDRWGGLDLLINNAGVAAGGRVDTIPVEDWRWVIDTNLMGVVKGCRTFTPLFKTQRAGRIVNVASMAGLVHPPGMSSYNASKAAVVALSETMLHELAAYGVGVSVICASFFRTNLDRSLRGSDPELEEAARRLITGAKYDAATIAARAVKALDKGRFLVMTHAEGRTAYRLKRYSPPAYHRVMKRAGARLATRGARAARSSRSPN